jgi:hypothetical protein
MAINSPQRSLASRTNTLCRRRQLILALGGDNDGHIIDVSDLPHGDGLLDEFRLRCKISVKIAYPLDFRSSIAALT